MIRTYLLLLSLVVFIISCTSHPTADQIIDRAIDRAGGSQYNHKKISFEFRGKTYISCREDGMFYLKRITDDSMHVVDILSNNGFKRIVDGQQVVLADTTMASYANSVNSVHYFAYLPYGLTGEAVNKELLGEVMIKNKPYYKIKVWFNEQGGGADYEDIFVYWIEKENYQMDYLAYKFHVNGGGMRFRAAYNKREIGGITFVDYNNFKPKDNTVSLFDLDSLFKQNNLALLSTIELENLRVEKVDCTF